MLKSLAQLDFTSFHDFQDWSFALPQSKPVDCLMANLRRLLEAVREKVLDDNLLVFKPCAEMLDFMGMKLGVKVKNLFLLKSLMEFCDATGKDPKKRTHVVELKGGIAVHAREDLLLNTLFLALPKWQHAHSIKHIAFFFEAHDLFGFNAAYGNRSETNLWRSMSEEGATKRFVVNHKISGVIAVWSESMEVVADLANECAQLRPDTLVLRVLRATGNANNHEEIREVVSQKSPDNVFTLWIREDVPTCGKFTRPLNPSDSLLTQLLDANPLDFASSSLLDWGKAMNEEHGTDVTEVSYSSLPLPRLGNSFECPACTRTFRTEKAKNDHLLHKKDDIHVQYRQQET